MAVIKSENAPRAARPFSMTDIEAHARAMLLKARAQAEQLLAAAQAECDAIKAQARAEGLAAGKREGVAQGLPEGLEKGRKQAFEEEKQRLGEAYAAMVAVTQAVDQSREAWAASAEAEVLPLALAIARKVTRRAGLVETEVVRANLREALKLITNKHEVRLAVNPTQRAIAETTVTELQQQWPQLTHVKIVDDESIAPGGCRASTLGGEIDADLEHQLDRIISELVPTA
ncbi:MAG: FliH/SctL family protein [Tepidisphaeraceae bacterium]